MIWPVKPTTTRLGRETFDVVCQFRAFTIDDGRRDLKIFGGRCGQYVFVSTASAYQKPLPQGRITEQTPLENPFWEYSRQKAAVEALLMEAHGHGQLAVTIVRPSLTYRRRFPGTFASGDDWAWRMLQGRPVIVHGDGQALWTLTHSRDFAALFVPLLGNSNALGEAFQIMTDTAYTWQFLFQTVGRALGVEPKLTFVPTQTLVRYNPAWTGPLLGDKSWTSLFDTAKIEARKWPCPPTGPPRRRFRAGEAKISRADAIVHAGRSVARADRSHRERAERVGEPMSVPCPTGTRKRRPNAYSLLRALRRKLRERLYAKRVRT